MAGRKQGYIFVWNNYTDQTEDFLQNKLKCSYLVYGHEYAPTTGTPHIQGYVFWKDAKSISAARKTLKGADVRLCLGTPDQNYDYATKDLNNIFEKGTRPKTHNEKGEAGRQVYDHALECALNDRLSEVNPGVLIRCYNNLTRIRDDFRPRPELSVIQELRVWQQNLLTELLGIPDRRKIIWYVDEVGGAGKTEMALKLTVENGATVFDNGKTADLAHALPPKPTIVLFDLPRTCYEVVNYQIIEKVKDGFVFSPKFNSHAKVFPKPHVVVFSNFRPDLSRLSVDRWDIRIL